MGDLHFSQGDGEITFCGATEMAGWLHLRCTFSGCIRQGTLFAERRQKWPLARRTIHYTNGMEV